MAVDSSITEDWLAETPQQREAFLERGKKRWEEIKSSCFVEHVGGKLEILYMLLGSGNLNIHYWPWVYHRGEKNGEEVPSEELNRIMTKFNKKMFTEWNKSLDT